MDEVLGTHRVGSAAIAVNPDFPRLPLAKAIRAMIDATAASEAVTSAVIEQLRQGRDLAIASK